MRSLILSTPACAQAVSFSPPGGVVAIAATHHDMVARITVEDDGPGVSDGEREQIFRRFYRVDRSRTTPGSGLGLSLASAVAHAHGADIRAEDAGPGLRIVVDFPAMGAVPAATSPR